MLSVITSSELASVLVPIGEREISGLDLVDSWAYEVLRLYRESFGSETRESWIPDDFVAALYTRDRLETVLRGLGDERELPSVLAVDELFRSFTVADPARVLNEWDSDELPSEPWWWQRIPKQGPIAKELSKFAAGRATRRD